MPPQNPNVAIVFRNFKAYGHDKYSHIGLGINAYHTARVLRAHGIPADPVSVFYVTDIAPKLKGTPYTHVILDAPWIQKGDLTALLSQFPDKLFIVRCHSQVGFLQVDPGAVQIILDDLSLQESLLNLRVAGNSHRFTRFIEHVYNKRCLLLPNLYDLERPVVRGFSDVDEVIRVASFGSIRHLKMHSVAAAGALWLARKHRKQLEFHLSVHRDEHGDGALRAIRNMFAPLPWAKLIENPWADWSEFRTLVANMNLFLQVSATETFNIATADAIAEGVPCVVTHAIDWVPERWKVEIDDVEAIANTGWALLADPTVPAEGLRALYRNQEEAFEHWQRVLFAVS